MQQRRLRLGDILDDYCPRERRITNHAVVAMIGDTIKQTRCTTCDAEHSYKEAHVPRRRKKDTPAALYDEVLAQREEGSGLREGNGRLSAAPVDQAAEPEGVAPAANVSADGIEEGTLPEDVGEVSEGRQDEGPVHRPLIRATLPRQEGQTPTRPVPDFTVRQAAGRNGSFMRSDGSGLRRGGRNRRPGPGQRDDLRGAHAPHFQQHGSRRSVDRRQLPPGAPRPGHASRHAKKRSR